MSPFSHNRVGVLTLVAMTLLFTIFVGILTWGRIAAQSGCLSTAQDFWYAFEHPGASNPPEEPCVDVNLMTTIQGPCLCSLNQHEECSDYLATSANSSLAWISGSETLEEYLRCSRTNPNDRWQAVQAMLTFVGFTQDYINQSCSYRLAILERAVADQEGLFIPTFNQWFHELRIKFGLDFDADVVKELSLHNFLDFHNLTQCSEGHANVPGHCGPDFEVVRQICQPAFEDHGTAACVQAFADALDGGFQASATHVRALLYFCFDANELHTGRGYGYDGQDFTGAEFLVTNARLNETFQAQVYALNPSDISPVN